MRAGLGPNFLTGPGPGRKIASNPGRIFDRIRIGPELLLNMIFDHMQCNIVNGISALLVLPNFICIE